MKRSMIDILFSLGYLVIFAVLQLIGLYAFGVPVGGGVWWLLVASMVSGMLYSSVHIATIIKIQKKKHKSSEQVKLDDDKVPDLDEIFPPYNHNKK